MVLRTLFPVLLRFLDHARDEVDVDLREANVARINVSARNLFAVMRAAIDLEDVIVKFSTKAEARDAKIANGLQFVIGERARLGFECYFFDFGPRQLALLAFQETRCFS